MDVVSESLAVQTKKKKERESERGGGSISLFHKKGSMSISMTEQGFVSSKLSKTVGCSTPKMPIDWPLQITLAHLPGKKVGSIKERNYQFFLLLLYPGEKWLTVDRLDIVSNRLVLATRLLVENLHNAVKEAVNNLKARGDIEVEGAKLPKVLGPHVLRGVLNDHVRDLEELEGKGHLLVAEGSLEHARDEGGPRLLELDGLGV